MGSGYKNFTAGSVLTASDVNNYLMEQSVMFFSTTAARDSAIGASAEDGMVVYIGSNDSSEGLYTYNGTSWRKGPGWNAPWGRVAHAVSTANSDNATVTGTFADWDDLEVTWTAISNRLYRTTVNGHLKTDNASGDFAELIIATGAGAALARAQRALVSNLIYEQASTVYLEGNATGSTTRKAMVNRVSGTGTVIGYAAAGYQASIIVEDVGPIGAPS